MTPPVVNTSTSDLKLQSRVLALEPGMYIFRYASDLPPGQEVCITLQQAPLGKGTIDCFPAEGVVRNTLTKLGDCVVIRVKGDTGAVLITEYHLASGGSRTVDLRIDRIDTSAEILKRGQGVQPAVIAQATIASPAEPAPTAEPAAEPVAAPVAAPAAADTVAPRPATARRTRPMVRAANAEPAAAAAAEPAAEAPQVARLQFEGHIERRGDVRIEQGWLGAPTGAARLEGFSIAWQDKPQGVDLAYSCRVEGMGKQPAALSGNFIGTRGKAAGVIAVTFGLVGPKQKQFRLDGQVVFSGCPPQTIVNGQELSGPTGREHLVAIEVSISPKSEANAPRYQSPWEDPAITKIYKAQG